MFEYKSLTGWFPPLWPYGSLNVVAPRDLAINWWPRQIPKIGISEKIKSLTLSKILDKLFGSPGPGDNTIPSGLDSIISDDLELNG